MWWRIVACLEPSLDLLGTALQNRGVSTVAASGTTLRYVKADPSKPIGSRHSGTAWSFPSRCPRRHVYAGTVPSRLV